MIGFAAALLAGGASGRSEPAKLVPLMNVPGETLVHDAFADSLPKEWRVGKGTWTAEAGSVHGTEITSDNHRAVIRHAVTFTNAIISFSFRLDHAKQINLSINDAKDHLCRVIISAHGLIVQKDDNDHNGPDKAVVLSRVSANLAPNEWHTAIVELNGSEMVAQVDGAAKPGFGAHPMIGRPKASVGFVVAGGPAEFRDVSIVAATPRPEWAETKKQLGAP